MAEYVLLTGATGLVGQYLLRDLLLRETPVAVLIRASGGQSARERVEQVLTYWEQELGRSLPRPVCLEGDIATAGLGLDAKARRWVAEHRLRVLHNAASLTFLGKDRSRDPWLSNLIGTGHVLDFCRQAGVRELHYVSTAYVCGRQAGPVREEDLDHGQEFRNDYEASKFQAEKLVRSATFLDRLTVYRPAVVVGDSVTGYTSTYHGLYSYLQFAWVVRQYATLEEDGRWHAPLRLNLTGDEPRNLVPVDWVSAVIAYLVLTPAHHGQTYHLTPLRPVTARQIEEAMSSHFGYYGPTFAGPEALGNGDLNELEKTFYEYVSRYQPYWSEDPIFDCTNTLAAAGHLHCPPTDTALIGRLIDYAVADRWGKRRK
jgi:nucleoside-diphosphate-sugar epimerase